MAGTGSRFTESGYTLPKPLIPVSGVPMIIKAIRDMPKSNKWIFLARKEHIDEYKIDALIKTEIPNAIIIPVEKTTEGQACTCMLAEPYLDPDEPLFIAACDNGYAYDKEKYERLCNDPDVDSVFWTFTERETLRRNPSAWGWCVLESDEITIRDMSVKIPVSNNPYEDHAIVASFFFKRAKDFINAVNLMIKDNYRIKNEFYVDAVPIFMKKLGKRCVIFDVDYYFGWGAPKDLYDYQKLEYFCSNEIEQAGISEEEKKALPLIKKYLSTGNEKTADEIKNNSNKTD